MLTVFTYRRLQEMGQLGNQLWEIAGTLGHAWRAGGTVAFPPWDYLPYFNVPENWFVADVPEGPGIVDLSDDYLQDLDHFASYAEQIRRYFQPRPAVRDQLATRFPWFYELDLPVAVHARRGDYLRWPEHYPVASVDYYRRAVAEMRSRHQGARFVVFSDDIRWCRRTFPNDFLFVDGVPRGTTPAARKRQGEPQDYWDLFLMAECAGHIIANSTFSWWGAFLAGDPHACYPEVWYGPQLAHVDWRRMIPEGWLGL